MHHTIVTHPSSLSAIISTIFITHQPFNIRTSELQTNSIRHQQHRRSSLADHLAVYMQLNHMCRRHICMCGCICMFVCVYSVSYYHRETHSSHACPGRCEPRSHSAIARPHPYLYIFTKTIHHCLVARLKL